MLTREDALWNSIGNGMHLNNDNYLKILKNPEVWFEHAFAHKIVADKILVDVIMKKDFLLSLRKEQNLNRYVILWSNALYHYGIGIENGLKGAIVKNQPELVNFDISVDEEDYLDEFLSGYWSREY